MSTVCSSGIWRMEALSPCVRQDHEEAQWLVKARAGEDAAFRWFLGRYRQRVVRLAAHVLRRESDAEDVAQEAFIKAFQSLRSYRGDGDFYRWIAQIVVRICIDRQRHTFWHCEVSVDDAVIEKAMGESLQGELLTTRILVKTLMAQLTPPMRAALVLRVVDGLEYEEISQILSIPIGTVRSRLNTARAQFRSLWQAVLQEEYDV